MLKYDNLNDLTWYVSAIPPRCILSQRYDATLLCFDNISVLAHIVIPLFLQNKTSISDASHSTMLLKLCFYTERLKKNDT